MKFRNLFALLLVVATMLPAFAKKKDVHEFNLSNGMKILVKEDHRAPTVVHMIWYKTGSIDECNGTSGVAHVLEHLMFKGTKNLKPGEFSRRVAALGGRGNAFTSQDYTAYFQQVGSNKLPEVMALEAERMTNLILDEAVFKPELRVVMEERRWRIEDRPAALVGEALHATAFTAHPYRHPIIGWMSDLQNMTVQDAQDWYQRWYAPNNAIMVVAGDVDANQVRDLAEKHFGKIPARTVQKTRVQNEPKQRGIRRTEVKAPAENSYVVLAFKVPGLRNVEKDDEVYALDVLSAVLDGYDNARLNAALVRTDKVAHNVGANYDAMARGPVLFVLSGTPSQDVSTQALEQRLRAEVDRIAKHGVTEQELRRVKRQLLASQIYKRDSVFGQAMEIGALEMVGLHHSDMDRMIEKLKAVTPQQVQAVAGKYFGDDALTVVTLAPQPLEAEKSVAPKSLKH